MAKIEKPTVKVRNKQREFRVRKHSSALNATPKIDEYTYYESDKNKRLKKVSPLEVKHDGISFSERLKQLQSFIDKYEGIKTRLEVSSEALTALLIEFGYNTPNVELEALIGDILKLNIIHPIKTYIGFELKNGYIVGKGYDVILEERELPEDIYNGYYQYLDEKIKVDSEKYHQYWGSLL